MKKLRTGLLGAAAFVATGAAAHADALSDLKSEIESMNGRIAALEAQQTVPDGFRLLTISDGSIEETPGSPLTARERAAYGDRARFLSVMPTADAPAGTTISWSGYARAGVVYNRVDGDTKDKAYTFQRGTWVRDQAKDVSGSTKLDDWDVGERAQLLLQAKTDSSAGEVGVEMKLRADFNGNGPADLYGKVVWGYWSMTPDLTLGGGYNQSLGDIVYGYDGSCTCYFTDNADVDFDPGDTTQMRVSYAAGPVTVALAVEDASLTNDTVSAGMLGVAGEIAYSGDVFSGEIAGVWRDSDRTQTGASDIWQLGLGGSIKMGDIGSFTFAAATGQGPYEVETQGTIINGLAYDNTWWGASAFTSVNLSTATHVELAGGYKHREGDQSRYNGYQVSDVEYETYAVLGGLYYSPVSQLTLGFEGEWYTTSTSGDARADDLRYDVRADEDNLWLDAVAVWSF